jgi:hypothetical protein
MILDHSKLGTQTLPKKDTGMCIKVGRRIGGEKSSTTVLIDPT